MYKPCIGHHAAFFAATLLLAGCSVEVTPHDRDRAELPGPGDPCGGNAGLTCPDGAFCQLADGECQRAEATGTCQTLDGNCPTIWSPVCGCDGVTYENRCMATAAEQNVAQEGLCEEEECDPTLICGAAITCVDGLRYPSTCGPRNCDQPMGPCEEAPVVCGGIAGLTCPEEEFCQFNDGECQLPDASGTCQPRPDACTTDWRPVCGCDGITYGNRCGAAAAGQSVAQEGSCEEEADACGGIAGLTCPDGAFCQFAEGECHLPDAMGTCQVIPVDGGCGAVWQPVCGCDGETYGNGCQALMAGQSVAHQGECEASEQCDPTLVCGQAVTCVDGQLYPTTCGPRNCDRPGGPCAPASSLP